MSTKEIKENLKRNIDNLSASDARLAARDLDLYFQYLQDRREMPIKGRLNFEQYQKLSRSLAQAEKGRLIPAHKIFGEIKRKYGFGN